MDYIRPFWAIVTIFLLTACATGVQTGMQLIVSDVPAVQSDASVDVTDAAVEPVDVVDIAVVDAVATDAGSPETVADAVAADSAMSPRDSAADTGTRDVVDVQPVSTCPPEYPASCGQVCANLLTNPYRCGGCDIKCPTGASCVNGSCVTPIQCASHLTACSGQCVNLQSDTGNCGQCGTRCPSWQFCTNGQCACPYGAADCDSNPANGCETQIINNRENCGTCSHRCFNYQQCAGLVCAG